MIKRHSFLHQCRTIVLNCSFAGEFKRAEIWLVATSIRYVNAKLRETIEDNCSTLLRPKLDTKVTRKISPYLLKTYVPSCKSCHSFLHQCRTIVLNCSFSGEFKRAEFSPVETSIRFANSKLRETIEDNCFTLLRPTFDTKVARKVSPYLFKTYVPSCKSCHAWGLWLLP